MQKFISNPENILTIGDFLTWASEEFITQQLYFGHGTDNAWDEAVMLVLYVLQLPAENDSAILSTELNQPQRDKLILLAQHRIATRIPVPYLTNEAWFAGERYYVNQDVLIPRSPLAETIANHFQPWLGTTQPKHILDLCTGSGCLAIYCAKQFPSSQVDAIDISARALQVANKNINLHACTERVHAIESDLFKAVAGQRYDIIISNPPYVGLDEMQELPAEYTHEPSLALESGAEGLDLTIQILRQAKEYLQPDGLLIVEVGYSWPSLVDMYPQVPFTWLEFANGGEGVFLLTAEELKSFAGVF
jgi:ribosomal protein L3 glutamine methyltransferase